MAYAFVSANSQYIHSTSSISQIAVPLTLAVWYQRAARGSNMAFLSHDRTNGIDRYTISAGTSDVTRATAATPSVPSGNFSTITGENLSAWNNAVAQYNATNNRVIYLNNNAGTPNTVDTNPSGLNNLDIGVQWNTTLQNYTNGLLAEVAVWNIALSNDDVTALFKGFKAFRVRPQNLVYYVPLIRNIQEIKAGLGLTNENTATVTDHPRVY
jgi:hypothetical protein